MTGLGTEIYHDFKGSMSSLVDIFNKQLVPAIQQGAILTKDYVLDLFGRYIQYTIVVDILWILALLLFIGLCLYFVKPIIEYNKTLSYDERGMPILGYILFLSAPFILSIISFVETTNHLVQTIFIPELTIYEKIVELKQ